MNINKKAVRIIIILIISILIILLKEGNVYGVKDFSYKLGSRDIIYTRKGNAIEYGAATEACRNVTRAETLGLDGKSNPNFYCVSEGVSSLDGENSFHIAGFIEIGPDGYVVDQYKGGNTTTYIIPWDELRY